MKRWLGLDGALGAFGAALVTDDPHHPPRAETSAGKDALERGLGVVERVLDGLRFGELDGIAVTSGPGTFTGLRIALAYAKSLAFATGLPLVAVSSYDALESPDAELPRATFVHGRVGVACVRLATPGEHWVRCGGYAELAEALVTRLGPGELLAYGRPEGVAPALGERGLIVRAAPSSVPPPAVAVALRALAGARAADAHGVRADYGEAPYAERSPSPRA